MQGKLLRIQGHVQGVMFRESLRREADSMGIVGWVRNRTDGSVEAFLSGPAEGVALLIAWCNQGPPRAKVDAVAVSDFNDPGVFSRLERKETL